MLEFYQIYPKLGYLALEGVNFEGFEIATSSSVSFYKRAQIMNERNFCYIYPSWQPYFERLLFDLSQQLCFINTELLKANSCNIDLIVSNVANITPTGKSEEGASLNSSYINANLLNGLNLKYWEAVVFFKTQLFQTYYFCQVNT